MIDFSSFELKSEVEKKFKINKHKDSTSFKISFYDTPKFEELKKKCVFVKEDDKFLRFLDKTKEVVENEVEEPIEPDSEAEDSAIIPEVENSVDLVSKVAALEAELKKIIVSGTDDYKKARKEVIKKFFDTVDGKSCDRILEYIQKNTKKAANF